MKLLTKELEKKLPTYEEIQEDKDPMVIAKYFHPMSSWTWYAISYNPETRTFFGLVDGQEKEMGSFSLTEMENINIMGLGIERDLYFDPMPLSELVKKLNAGQHV